jgi:hypothetical protein
MCESAPGNDPAQIHGANGLTCRSASGPHADSQFGAVEAIRHLHAHIHRTAHTAPLMMGKAQIAQDEALETVEAAKHFLAFDAAHRFAAHRCGEPIKRTLGRAADIEKAGGLIRIAGRRSIQYPDPARPEGPLHNGANWGAGHRPLLTRQVLGSRSV